ncbi:MAG: hypothetical protein CL842_06105 [Crocinitomicaceae bacterium]|jgi:hypothetical protein|nr:hypothetical protein [Crocinitomicaceae bacterium]|tara:strand:- start:33215 stop:33628 length:414 start_codon:yes stop_codon:yes gene_type:complete
MARRFFIFSIGLLFGSVLVYQLLIKGTDREFYGSWLPEGRVLKKIRTGLDKQHLKLDCWTKCASIFNSDIDYLLENGDVNFSRSKTQGSEKSYFVDSELESEQLLEVTFGMVGEQISIQEITVDKKNTFKAKDCSCD